MPQGRLRGQHIGGAAGITVVTRRGTGHVSILPAPGGWSRPGRLLPAACRLPAAACPPPWVAACPPPRVAACPQAAVPGRRLPGGQLAKTSQTVKAHLAVAPGCS